ncbi:hypothetical protein ACFWMJ_04065 [Streptomyces hawaiiensis]|uniref:hypothetical protein n=1 Tax=Streptomyces hawaiiensis TaxID=67305 RepID=UPI00364E2178
MTVDKGGGAARAEITEAGRFCVRHGRHPDDAESADRGEPSEPVESSASYGERPIARVRRAKARELVERLLAEGHVRFAHADDEEIAEWRRVVNYAKRHGMEPEGKRIEKVPYGRLGLEFFLAKGPHPNARSQADLAGASTARLELDGTGKAYTIDHSGGRLYEVTLADGAQRVVATGLGTCEGLALDLANGQIYVSNRQGQLWRISHRAAQALGGVGKVVAPEAHGA